MSKRLSAILDKYDTVIFDMDGVITSEQKYFDCAALTLYQLWSEPFDVQYAGRNVSLIRTITFYNDRIISLLKDLGVNSNWDLTYVVYAISQIKNTYNPTEIYAEIKSLNLTALELYEYLGKNCPAGGRDGEGYRYIVKLFQEWCLGDELYLEVYNDSLSVCGKESQLANEVPLSDTAETVQLLRLLAQSKTLGVATGRLKYEAVAPLKAWGVLDLFDEDHFATYSDIINAEKLLGVSPLTKPAPYLFLKGALGHEYSDGDLVNNNYDKSKLKRVLAVGDAGADLFSAHAAGMDFAAVLTGVSGKKARSFFEANNAEYILDSALCLMEEEHE